MFSVKKHIGIRVILILFLQVPILLFAQSEAIQRTLENLSENQENIPDYSELIDELEILEKQPLNLNSDQVDLLYRLFLINELQLENIKKYKTEYGPFMSSNELLLIDGFTPEQVELLLPYIEAKEVEKTRTPKLKQLLKYGQNTFFLRYQRVLEKADGYQDLAEDASLNSVYLGSPDKYYLKYKYTYSNQIQWGITAEKDAGELFFNPPSNPDLEAASAPYYTKGFDFTSFHLYGQNLGFVKQIALGDYQLLFGQGLTLWTGLSFGKSADAVHLKRFESFVKPNTSVNENGFLRGAALHIGKNRWSAIVFYSKNQQDASIQTAEDGQEYVSTLLYTGLHRTVSELSKKNVIDVELYGGHLKYNWKNLSLGFTAFNTLLSKELITASSPDNLFDFRGNSLSNYGIDYSFKIWKASLYGEMAMGSEGGKAMISGVNIPLHSRVYLALLYRNYAPDYHNLFATALAENSTATNEQGFFAGTEILLNKKMNLQAYVDFFKFPWLKFEQDAPSKGVEYRMQLFYDYSRNIRMLFKVKYKQKEANTQDESISASYFLQNQTKFNWQYQLNYKVSPNFELRNRIEIVQYQESYSKLKSMGYMLYQDINYTSPNLRFGISTRLAIFNTDSFSSAIYAYENDVLYAFSIPAYYGKGLRFYQLVSYSFNDKLKMWARYSLSYYPDKTLIGSGLDQIGGPLKSEIKLQLQLKI